MIGINSHVTKTDLQCSPLCVNSMKLMANAQENGGIGITKSGAFISNNVDIQVKNMPEGRNKEDFKFNLTYEMTVRRIRLCSASSASSAV